jgi:hypothetical protein
MCLATKTMKKKTTKKIHLNQPTPAKIKKMTKRKKSNPLKIPRTISQLPPDTDVAEAAEADVIAE